MKQQSVKNTTLANTRSWPWYKAWSSTLFHPNIATGETLLSEGNVKFWQAILWLVVSSIVSAIVMQLLIMVKEPNQFTWQSFFTMTGRNLIGSLIIPIGILFFCTAIHLVAKLFRSKGTFQNFFVVYAAFFAPLWIPFFITVNLGISVYKIQAFVWLFLILWLYWLLVINPVAIRAVYRFRWIGAFLISLAVISCFLVLFLVYCLRTTLVF